MTRNLPEAATGNDGGSRRSSQEQHAVWLAGRVYTLLRHYWTDDLPDAVLSAMATDWVKVLAGLPRDAIEAACISYLRDEPRRRPTPGAILALARKSLPRPQVVPMPAPPEPPRVRVTAEQAQAILEQYGYAPKRMPGD